MDFIDEIFGIDDFGGIDEFDGIDLMAIYLSTFEEEELEDFDKKGNDYAD